MIVQIHQTSIRNKGTNLLVMVPRLLDVGQHLVHRVGGVAGAEDLGTQPGHAGGEELVDVVVLEVEDEVVAVLAIGQLLQVFVGVLADLEPLVDADLVFEVGVVGDEACESIVKPFMIKLNACYKCSRSIPTQSDAQALNESLLRPAGLVIFL